MLFGFDLDPSMPGSIKVRTWSLRCRNAARSIGRRMDQGNVKPQGNHGREIWD